MSQRRYHKKSRYGCFQCKQSRKKCDENHPQCGRCQKIGQQCSLWDSDSTSLIFVSGNPAQGRLIQKSSSTHVDTQRRNETAISFMASSSTSSTSDTPSFFSGDLHADSRLADCRISDAEKDRLRLMHNYTLHTAATLTELSVPVNRDQTLWTTFAVDLAFEYDLVLHGLLSLSALHLALRGISKQRNTILAIHHYDRGLALFRPHLSNITIQNYEAIFAFTTIVIVYAFGIQRCSESTANPIAKMHQILTLISKSRLISKSHIEALRSCRWSVMMLPEPYPALDEPLPETMEIMLANLNRRVPGTAKTAAQANIYNAAIESLRYVLIIASTPRPAQHSLVLFPMMSPGEFWDMVRNHEPLALAVLANYVVMIHRQRSSIWFEGLGKETVDAIRATLGTEWHDCIAWAVEEMRT